MWKLIRLEWRKNQIGKYIRNAVILAAVLGMFLFAFTYLGIANDPDTGMPDGRDVYEYIVSCVYRSDAGFLSCVCLSK